MKDDRVPKVGQYLYASCSAMWYGPIMRVGKDENEADTIDFIVENINEFMTTDRFEPEENERSLFEIKPHGPVEFCNVQWKSSREKSDEPLRILCNTPGDGCRRCTGIFMVTDKNNYNCSPWNDGLLDAEIGKLFGITKKDD